MVSSFMLAVFFLAFIFFALGSATLLSSVTGGHERTKYWTRIFSGLGFVFLAVSGYIAIPFLPGNSHVSTFIMASAFVLFGFWMIYLGLKIRRCVLSK